MLGFIKRNVRTSNTSTKELAYKTLVRPTAEYASSVWSPNQKDLKYQIERVQRRAARYVTRRYEQKDSVTDMLHQLKWESLERRRQKARLVMGYRVIHQLVQIPGEQLIPSTVCTRGNDQKFQQLPARTNYYKCSFFPSVIPLWNSLPVTITSAGSLDDFKARLVDAEILL